MSDIEKKEEMDKEELVYVMALMLNCQDFKAQINKLSKGCLFRLFDGFKERGNAFNNIELNLRQAEAKVMELEGLVSRLEQKNKDLFANLKREVNKSKGKSRVQ